MTKARWAWEDLFLISQNRRRGGDHVEEIAGGASLSTFFERRAEQTESFQCGNAGSTAVEVKMGINGVQPAIAILNDVVGVKVKDIDFAQKFVIEDEIAAKRVRGWVTQFMTDETRF
jgi:hypothetical protein